MERESTEGPNRPDSLPERHSPTLVIAGRYRVLSTLGVGGMGTVYRAHDDRLDRTVALKTVHPQYLAHPMASRRFFREAQALARLNHPNILTLYDSGQDGDLHYLVMELGGRDLARVLHEHGGPLLLDRALPIALGVGRALEYVHARGVIHRDLKPANVLASPPEELQQEQGTGNREQGDASFPVPRSLFPVKVMDFGLARFKGDPALTAATEQIGTPHYMGPEQVLGQEADERSDLYAFGVLLFELTTGDRPFKSDFTQAILYQQVRRPEDALQHQPRRPGGAGCPHPPPHGEGAVPAPGHRRRGPAGAGGAGPLSWPLPQSWERGGIRPGAPSSPTVGRGGLGR